MVFKPAEITPRMAIELAKIAQDAGVPDGIISVLPGKGSIVGDALVKHPLIQRIAFTGGTNVGLGIQRLAAEKLMPTSLELGGKSPTIVCADADLDHAVAGVLYGIFSSSGESCIAGSRAFVHASVYDEFKRRLLAGVQGLRVGDPADDRTQMGPLVNLSHRASVERYVQLGVEEGGRVLHGGHRPEGGIFDQGSFYLPTVIEGLPNTARMCQEEIFGPVLALLPWHDEADLLAQCNDNVYGLASGIWTRDYKAAWRIGSALKTGTVWINTYKLFSVSTPFGGVKLSGTGREKGRMGILEYTSQKSFYWGLNENPLPWASA
jgi:acyl-CoA reductase-like NAD-dependent aldehyde dehydrogenase